MIQDLPGPSVPYPCDGPSRLRTSESIACPLCRQPVPRPPACRDGSRPMVECPPCDLYFDFGDDEIYLDLK